MKMKDPILKKYLNFLSRDMQENPKNVQPIDSKLVKRIQSLVANVNIDLNTNLSEEDE